MGKGKNDIDELCSLFCIVTWLKPVTVCIALHQLFIARALILYIYSLCFIKLIAIIDVFSV
jgi:hypothetical protein